MSLLDSMMTDCVIMKKTTAADGEGGSTVAYTEGPEIKAAIVRDSSSQEEKAEADQVTATYTITTPESTVLAFHDVVKRVSDGATFRVTNNAADSQPPAMSTIRISQVTAEAWSIPQ